MGQSGAGRTGAGEEVGPIHAGRYLFFWQNVCWCSTVLHWYVRGGENGGLRRNQTVSVSLSLSPSPSLEIAARIRNGPSEGKELDLPHVFRIVGIFKNEYLNRKYCVFS